VRGRARAWKNGGVYVPPAFVVDEGAAWDIVRDAGAGLLVLAAPDGLASVFVPVLVDEGGRRLSAHVARANPWWRGVEPDAEVLAFFQVASAYVSPSNYPSRLEEPGVVPTWNYVAAEVHGRLSVRDDPAWVDAQVRRLTDAFERDRDPRWWVDDAPAHYVAAMLGSIVGLEIDVTSIEGKAKLSQNRPPVDHDQVRANLGEGSRGERDVAERMRGPAR
jgi:transcriptional regulator